MKLVLVALCLVAAAVAAPAGPSAPEEPTKILRSAFDQQPDGAYNFGYETEDGIQRNEDGELKQVQDEDNKPRTVLVMRGSYSYTDPDGKPVSVTYFADETGFHAESDRIPKPARR